MIKHILTFYLTTAIPLLYLFVLWSIAATPNTFPPSYIPVIKILSHPTARYISLSFSACGALLWIWSYYHLRHSFGVLPKTKIKHITSGPYKHFKHPMYLAIFLTFTGLALATLSLPGLLTNLLILTPINLIRAKKETKLLNQSNNK